MGVVGFHKECFNFFHDFSTCDLNILLSVITITWWFLYRLVILLKLLDNIFDDNIPGIFVFSSYMSSSQIYHKVAILDLREISLVAEKNVTNYFAISLVKDQVNSVRCVNREKRTTSMLCANRLLLTTI